MIYKVKLKNSDNPVLLDEKGYDYITNDIRLMKIEFAKNLRRHSSGCAVFQKVWKNEDGSYHTETIYLHKLIAEKFLSETKTEKANLVGAINGNKLDCRLENLVYRSRSQSSRQRKTTSFTGYTGVYQEGKRFRAVISVNGKSRHIGMFGTPEEAARAYNKVSKELFGKDGKLNKIAEV